MSCGCKLSDPAPVKGHDFQRKLCPVHNGIIEKRYTVCIDCGCQIEFGPAGQIPKRCKPCLLIQNREKAKKYYQQPPPRPGARKITAVFECGCRMDRAKAKSRWIKGKLVVACPKHRTRLRRREAACVKCGKIIAAVGSAGIPWECQGCKYPVKDEAVRRREQACVDRSDCINRSACTDRHIEEVCRPCLGCTDYATAEVEYSFPAWRRYDPYFFSEAV